MPPPEWGGVVTILGVIGAFLCFLFDILYCLTIYIPNIPPKGGRGSFTVRPSPDKQ